MELVWARHHLRRLAGIPTFSLFSDPSLIAELFPDIVAVAERSPEAMARRWIAHVRPAVDTGDPCEDVAQACVHHPTALFLAEPSEFYFSVASQLLERAPRLAIVAVVAPDDPLLNLSTRLGALLRAGILTRPSAVNSTSPAPELNARSQAELRLYRALEAQPHTRGRFVLNQKLGIYFGSKRLEVDLFAPHAALAVEIDGYHHFTDATR